MGKPDDAESGHPQPEEQIVYHPGIIVQAACVILMILVFPIIAIIVIIVPPLRLPFLEDDDNDDVMLFGLSSILYMLLDPLFFYVPLINEETKCFMLDNRLKIAALVLRALGDIRYVREICFHIKECWAGRASASRHLKTKIAISTLSILPVPQVVILIFLPKMNGSRSLEIMKYLNSLILLQYLPRLYPIYKLCKVVNKEILDKKFTKLDRDSSKFSFDMLFSPKIKLKFAVAVNIYGYILASHVLGAFWYFFSIQREIGCWAYACRIENGCEFSTSCDENKSRNITLLKNLCRIDPPDATVFDFGIFLYALQSGVQASTNFSEKFLLCFSWGLRNLSSFASNLNTSTYGWENFFVVVISISGLILFMYLLGHAQTIMQESNKSDSIQRKMEAVIVPKIDSLSSHYKGLPDKMKPIIKTVVERNLEKDEDLIVENMFSILSLDLPKFPFDFASEIKCSLFLDKLTGVEGLKGYKDTEVLKGICDHLEPMIYMEGSFIIREGEPLDMMFFVTQGTVLIYPTNNGGSSSSSVTIKLIEKGKDSLYGEEKGKDSSYGEDNLNGEEKGKDSLYGEELLTNLAKWSSDEFSTLPIWTFSVKSHKKVEIFAIKASDLYRVLYK